MTDTLRELDDQFKEFVAEISDLTNWTKIQDDKYGVVYHFEAMDDSGETLHYYYEIFTFEFAREFVQGDTLRTLYGPFEEKVEQENGVYYLDENELTTLVQEKDIPESEFFTMIRNHFLSNLHVVDPFIDPIESWEV